MTLFLINCDLLLSYSYIILWLFKLQLESGFPQYSISCCLSALHKSWTAAVFIQLCEMTDGSHFKNTRRHLWDLWADFHTGRHCGLPDYREVKHSWSFYCQQRGVYYLLTFGVLLSHRLGHFRLSQFQPFSVFNAEIIENIKKDLFWATVNEYKSARRPLVCLASQPVHCKTGQ